MGVTQRVLASHAEEEGPRPSEVLRLRVDHVTVGDAAERVLTLLRDERVSRVLPEACVLYPTRAFEGKGTLEDADVLALRLGFFVAKRGSGYAASTHLERFGAPGRIVLTDDSRVMALGGVGMFPVVATPERIAETLRTGVFETRRPRVVQIHLSGKLRPFVGVVDAALELARRGTAERLGAIASETGEPVALEFGGPGARLLSVGERATLASAGRLLGAEHALFGSDEKTESYLREQRRSKAFRGLGPDAGASFAAAIPFDLGSVDPLVRTPEGRIAAIREEEGTPTARLLLGGGVATTLRDLLAVAQLLKSKRVAPHVEALLNPPSRQMLETLARQESLADLLATGLRLAEPDEALLTVSPSAERRGEWCLASADLRPAAREKTLALASPETVALSALEGKLTDPRGFKRPVRVVVPRSLPTEDVMLCRAPETRGPSRGKGRVDVRPQAAAVADAEVVELSVVAWPASAADLERFRSEPTLLVLERWGDLGEERAEALHDLRFLVAPDIPADDVRTLDARGVVALRCEERLAREMRASKRLALSTPASDRSVVEVALDSGVRRLERLPSSRKDD